MNLLPTSRGTLFTEPNPLRFVITIGIPFFCSLFAYFCTMRRGSTIQKMTAILAILVIFAGTQGFVISSHTCNSCGTYDETISLFGAISAESHDCQSEEPGSCCQTPAPLTETQGSCCSIPDPVADSPQSCCAESAPSCETVLGGVCCEYETERVAVETFTPEKSARIDIQIQPAVAAISYSEAVTPEPKRVSFDLHNKHGGGRDIVLLTCCLLI